jgi:hypothetical protein
MVSLLLPFAPNQGHHRIRLVSHRRRGGGGFPLPCFLGWAETPRKRGRLAEQAEALLWDEPKCTMHFLNYLSISFDLIQINSEFD